jgi:hypothetical protein
VRQLCQSHAFVLDCGACSVDRSAFRCHILVGFYFRRLLAAAR